MHQLPPKACKGVQIYDDSMTNKESAAALNLIVIFYGQ